MPVMGIGPIFLIWKTNVLPLYYTSKHNLVIFAQYNGLAVNRTPDLQLQIGDYAT